MVEHDFIISINESLQGINRSLGKIEGKVDNALELHTNCPARLGFEALREDTKSIKMEKKERRANETNSISPAMIRSLQPIVFKLLPWIITALLAGAAFTGYMLSSSGNSADMIKKISPLNPDHSTD